MVRNAMISGVRTLPINVNQRYMLVSQETKGENKVDHRDIILKIVLFHSRSFIVYKECCVSIE